MPGFDGTGPRGMGPMTGGGRGFCSPWGIGAAYRGYGMPSGTGYGYPYYGQPAAPGVAPFAPQVTREQELDFLKSQAQAVKGQLEQMESRMRELEAKGK
ncbi:MAG: DUF5320 domain-containing protein [Chloroflexi bacterium]|nr:DUF5320 domain-containing protein [Chloroflexota bacterium]